MNDTARSTFDAVVSDYYRVWFRYHPEAAVEAGVPGYGELLTPFDEEAHAALVCLNNELTVSLDALDRDALDPDTRLDFDVLYSAAWLENRYLLEVQPQRLDPLRLLPFNAIYQLTIRPVDNFAACLGARLRATPAHLAAAADFVRDRAGRVPALWLDSARGSAEQGIAFLLSLPAHPKVAQAAIADLDALLAAAEKAVRDYAAVLAGIPMQAASEFACGAKHFNDLLRLRHFLDVDADRLHELGTALFEQTQRDLKDVCRQLFGHEDIAAATRAIQAHHPSSAELLPAYVTQMRAARDFLERHDLVTLPAHEQLDVVETPVFLRNQIPFAAYSDPAPNDPEQRGHYYVTPPGDDSELVEHHYAGLMHTCVHEAWPGHHLQFVTANRNSVARSLPRLLNASATLYEGWALYSEQLMHEQGFLAQPEQRFVLLKDRLWRALRILIDVEIHTRGLSADAAIQRMVRDLGFPESQARAELNWYSRAPTVPMGYATGWAIINATRDRLRTQPAGPSLKAFHDRLLSAGSIALPLVIRRVFGESTWSSVRQMVFAS